MHHTESHSFLNTQHLLREEKMARTRWAQHRCPEVLRPISRNESHRDVRILEVRLRRCQHYISQCGDFWMKRSWSMNEADDRSFDLEHIGQNVPPFTNHPIHGFRTGNILVLVEIPFNAIILATAPQDHHAVLR